MALSVDSSPTLDVVPRQEEVLLREAVAGICSDFGPAYSQRLVEEGKPPTELWDALAARGFWGSTSPRSTAAAGSACGVGDGRGGDRGGLPLLLMVVSPAIAGAILARHGSEEQKERWLRGIGRRQTKIAFAITEPDAGTNTHNLSTSPRARSATAPV